MRTMTIVLALSLAACGGDGEDDAGVDAGDGAGDAGMDAGGDDAGIDAGADDAGPGGFDAGPGPDAGPDAGDTFDAGEFDGGPSSLLVTFPERDFVCATPGAVPCATTQAATTPMSRTVVVTREFAPRGVSYVLSEVGLPPPMMGPSGQLGVGFNLDGMDSADGSAAVTATCEEFQPDYDSVHEAVHPGVDNALAGFLPTIEALLDPATCPGGTTAGCIDALLLESINTGGFLLVLEITDVTSFVHDESVIAQLFLVQAPGGGAPMLDAGGRVAAGQTFSTVRALSMPGVGDFFDGRLRVRWPRVEFPAMSTAISGLFLPDELTQVELRGDVTPAGLTNAHLGGLGSVNQLVMQSEMIMPGIGMTIRSLLEGIADVTLTAAPDVCADLGTGLDLEGRSAVRTP